MPELPEVETVRRGLAPHLVDERLARVEVRSPALREPLDAEALTGLAGARIASVDRRAKYLLLHLERPADDGREPPRPVLAVHLGMSGRLRLVPAAAAAAERAPEDHEHLVLHLASGASVHLRDPRRFGMAFVIDADDLSADRHFAHLGIEPLGDDDSGPVDGPTLKQLAAGRRAPVKTFLLDATAMVGMGNIYACEALWRAGIHPKRSVARIGAERWQRLAETVVAVLEDALDQGGTTLRDHRRASGESGWFQVALAVYDREGLPCRRCERTVRRIVQSGRSTFYCPGCQH